MRTCKRTKLCLLAFLLVFGIIDYIEFTALLTIDPRAAPTVRLDEPTSCIVIRLRGGDCLLIPFAVRRMSPARAWLWTKSAWKGRRDSSILIRTVIIEHGACIHTEPRTISSHTTHTRPEKHKNVREACQQRSVYKIRFFDIRAELTSAHHIWLWPDDRARTRSLSACGSRCSMVLNFLDWMA